MADDDFGGVINRDALGGSDDDQCPACHFHPGHDPEEWFAEEARLRGYVLVIEPARAA